VNLEPLLPQTKRDNALQVAQHQINLQLPTPLDTIHSDACHRHRKPAMSFFDNVHIQEFVKKEEEEEVIERGRSREPKPRRTRPRMTPYDSESRPRGAACQKNAQTTGSRKTSLNDIAAAAAAAVVLDRTIPSQAMPLQRDGLASVPTPPHRHHHRHDHIHQQQPTHDHNTHHLHSKGTNDTSQAIDDAVDGMIKLYSYESQTPSRSEETKSETQAPLTSERQQCRQLYTAIQKERGVLALLKFQVQRDKGRLHKERQKLRDQVEKEIFAEKHALKARIERLEAMVFCSR